MVYFLLYLRSSVLGVFLFFFPKYNKGIQKHSCSMLNLKYLWSDIDRFLWRWITWNYIKCWFSCIFLLVVFESTSRQKKWYMCMKGSTCILGYRGIRNIAKQTVTFRKLLRLTEREIVSKVALTYQERSFQKRVRIK